MRPISRARTLTATAFASLLLGSTALYAGPATSEGADRIKAALQDYFTADKEVVSVTPVGEEYRIRLDFNSLLRKIPQVMVEASPMTFEVTPLGNGRWKVVQHEKNYHITAKMPGSVIEAKIGELEYSGIFDEALLVFSEGTGSMKNWEQIQTNTQETPGGTAAGAQKITTRTTTRIDKAVMTATASGTAAAIDTQVETSTTGTVTTAEMNVPAGADKTMLFSYVLKGENSKTVSAATGVNTQGIAGLIRFFASRPAATPLAADQNTLREQLGGAIPPVKSMKFTNVTVNQSAELKGAGTTTKVSVPQIQTTVSVASLGPDGQMSIVSSLKDLAITSDAWGDWVTPLVPTALDLNISAKDFDLDAAAKLAVTTFDLTTPRPFPDSFGRQLLGAVLPQGGLAITIDNMTVTAPSATLAMNAKADALTKGAPNASASISLTGYDAIMAALAKGPQTQDMVTATAMLGLARSYAKADATGNSVSWDIKATQKDGIVVNERVVVPGEPVAAAPVSPAPATPAPATPAPVAPAAPAP